MTGDELDRAIGFLLKAAARSEARIEQVNQQLSEGLEENRKLVAEVQQALSNFIQVSARRFEEQDEINRRHEETIRDVKETNRRIAETIGMLAQSDLLLDKRIGEVAESNRRQDETGRGLAETVRELAEVTRGLVETTRAQAAAQSHTDERLDTLINAVERYISGRQDGRQ